MNNELGTFGNFGLSNSFGWILSFGMFLVKLN